MNGIKFFFLDPSNSLTEAWQSAFEQHGLTQHNFAIINSTLQDLPEDLRTYDCIVSPANSYGRLDGGFDYYLSEALAPPDDHDAPTRITQNVLYSKWKGFAPPGTCTLIPLKNTPCFPNPHACRFIALVPTMRIPEKVIWNREIVYNCMWSLLATLTAHNESSEGGASGDEGISTVLMTGLATGVGEVSAERCAHQMALAIRDFVRASENPDKWGAADWDTILKNANDTRRTHRY
ncbi:macro domain-like protein [Crassisporium funariophilum]|nr:macro domain-like protein [Crassisporium funariophilum]